MARASKGTRGSKPAAIRKPAKRAGESRVKHADTSKPLKGTRTGEDIHHLLLDSLNETLAVVDETGVFTFANSIAAARLKTTPEALVGKTMWDLFPKETADRQMAVIRTVLETNQGLVDEAPAMVLGRLRWYRTRVEPLKKVCGKPREVLLLAVDITERKEMEDALRRREEQLRLFQSVLDSSHEAVGICDAAGRVVYVNRAYEELFGYTKAEAVRDTTPGRCCLDIESRASDEGLPANRTDSWEGEVVATHRSGRMFPLWRRLDRIRGPEGEVHYTFCLMHDITESKHAEELLRESEERFRAAYKSIPAPTYTWVRRCEDFILSEYNDAAVRITKGAISKLLGASLRELYADEPEIIEDLERCYREKTVVTRQMTYRLRSTGETRELDVRYAYVPPDSVLVHTVDFTDRVKAEEALRESEHRYSTLVEYAPYAIAVLDADTGLFVDANRYAETLFGLTRSELLRVGPLDMSPPTQPGGRPSTELGRARIREALAGASLTFEWTHRKANGEEFPCGVMLTRVPDASRRLIRVTIVDMSEAKRQERLIAQQQMAMIVANRLSSLGVMAAGLAHEINNPLATISAAAEQLEALAGAGDVDARQIGRLTAYVRRHVERIDRIVRGLRALSREGSADPFRPISLRAVVDETLDLCRTRFRAHGIDLRFSEPAGPAEVEGRATQISQVLLNLLNNAFDAVDGQDAPWVQIDIYEGPDWAELAVTDSGPGLPAEMRQRLFEPFFTTKSPGGGTGLGLSISKSLVDNHHGEIRFDAEAPNTRFVVRLPRTQPPRNG